MKSPQFDYVKPASLDEVFALLAEHGDDARVLAGGQTLLATLNMRLSEPRLVIDITGLNALRGIRVQGDRLYIGALTTHTEIENSALVAQHAPMLAQAAPHIAHRAIRNAGTWGGSIAYGDPAAEWPCCLCALDGTVHLQGAGGTRQVAATDFFQDLYTTALEPGEIVIGADVPLASAADWIAFDELARRHGDYAVAGLAVSARFQGTVAQRVNLCFLGIGAIPLRARRTETVLAGKTLDAATVEIAVASLKAELDPLPDLTHTPDTKRHLATVLARRLLTAAHASRSAIAA
ncbi:MAG: xanthine dehydrogenase family protein subunit M [Betaproteobacteria bacterium]|nr:xanthine dehydrogenase family protein subunit M [Betaproteobacteria bacterium]